MANKEVRIGVVGTGGWANSGHMVVYQQHPGSNWLAFVILTLYCRRIR